MRFFLLAAMSEMYFHRWYNSSRNLADFYEAFRFSSGIWITRFLRVARSSKYLASAFKWPSFKSLRAVTSIRFGGFEELVLTWNTGCPSSKGRLIHMHAPPFPHCVLRWNRPAPFAHNEQFASTSPKTSRIFLTLRAIIFIGRPSGALYGMRQTYGRICGNCYWFVPIAGPNKCCLSASPLHGNMDASLSCDFWQDERQKSTRAIQKRPVDELPEKDTSA